ncbi:MAG: PRC-barrel domain protein [Methanomassiliicoccales archaeon PtaB.Bin134]|jgi:sporulation protein YlmC with PRC-barrel domain|nr:MAG: PRC-barrel domain protein [Methanomassiliicoccales archaeon PtaB.Bin134]
MSGLEDIVGKEVISADAIIIGTVEGIALDVDNWKVTAIRVSVRKGNEAALNLKKKALGVQRVHVAAPQVSSVSDTVTLAVKMDQVKDVLLEDRKAPLSAGDLMNKRVVGHDGKQIGYLDNVYFDAGRTWEITKFGVKLDKSAKQALDLKKGIAPSSQITVLTKDVKTVGDMVMLALDTSGLKDYLNNKQVSKK